MYNRNWNSICDWAIKRLKAKNDCNSIYNYNKQLKGKHEDVKHDNRNKRGKREQKCRCFRMCLNLNDCLKQVDINCYKPTYMRASQVALKVKNMPVNAGDMRCEFNPWVGKIPCRRAWQPTPVFLPGKYHGQRTLDGWSP